MRIFDDKAQAGGIIVLVFGIFVIGFFYVAFGGLMNNIQVTNNQIIADPTFAYSQQHWDSMDALFKYWWAFPIFAIILFIIWGIKNGLTKAPGEI